MHPDVDQFLEKEKNWKNEMKLLREILLESGLTEEFKWRQPCYTHMGNNIAILGSFKASCVVSFFKGVHLRDEAQILQFAGENSQTAKLLRFTSSSEIEKYKHLIISYLREAVLLEEMGVKAKTDPTPAQPIPDELLTIWQQDKPFKKAFDALTPGRQRAYLMFFNAAKQSATRTDRINKYIPRILDGKGINDCSCGLSKKMPGCDGSHKFLKTAG